MIEETTEKGWKVLPVLFFFIIVAGVYLVLNTKDDRPGGLLLLLVTVGATAGFVVGGLAGLIIDIVTPFSTLTEIGGATGTLIGALAVPALTSPNTREA